MHWESSKLRRYLLGDISEEEKSEFDLQLLSNREFVTAMEVAEEELIDDYLDEILTVNELKRFKYLFLNSSQRMKQIEFSQQLKNHARQNLNERVIDQLKRDETAGFINRLKNRYSSFQRPTFAMLSLSIFLLILFGLVYFILQNRASRKPDLEENEIAQINQRDLSDLSEYATLARLTLIPEVTRDSTQLKTISWKNISELMLIRLALPSSITDERVQVKISHNNLTITNIMNIKVYKTNTGRDVRLLMPREKLATGRYLVEITDNHSTTAGATYTFEIEP